jgi:hypothetical protein
LFSAFYVVSASAGTLKINWTLLCVGFQWTIIGSFQTKANFFENFISKLNSFYLFAEQGMGVETNFKFPIKQLYLSLVLL